MAPSGSLTHLSDCLSSRPAFQRRLSSSTESARPGGTEVSHPLLGHQRLPRGALAPRLCDFVSVRSLLLAPAFVQATALVWWPRRAARRPPVIAAR